MPMWNFNFWLNTLLVKIKNRCPSIGFLEDQEIWGIEPLPLILRGHWFYDLFLEKRIYLLKKNLLVIKWSLKRGQEEGLWQVGEIKLNNVALVDDI